HRLRPAADRGLSPSGEDGCQGAARRQAGRPAGAATDHLRTRNQSRNRQSDRFDGTDEFALPRRQGDLTLIPVHRPSRTKVVQIRPTKGVRAIVNWLSALVDSGIRNGKEPCSRNTTTIISSVGRAASEPQSF